tara:strand:+ start:336 stop:572 length:237 start_codon:yes stop_codon:yes gene_type:complete
MCDQTDVVREVLGNVVSDNGKITINGEDCPADLAVTAETKIGDGYFPVIFEENGEGGHGNSRIIIELGPADHAREHSP